MIAKSFTEKSTTWTSLTPPAEYSDLAIAYDVLWKHLVEQAFSFIIKNRNHEVIGVAINCGSYDQPPAIPYNSSCQAMKRFFYDIEKSFR